MTDIFTDFWHRSLINPRYIEQGPTDVRQIIGQCPLNRRALLVMSAHVCGARHRSIIARYPTIYWSINNDVLSMYHQCYAHRSIIDHTLLANIQHLFVSFHGAQGVVAWILTGVGFLIQTFIKKNEYIEIIETDWESGNYSFNFICYLCGLSSIIFLSGGNVFLV